MNKNAMDNNQLEVSLNGKWQFTMAPPENYLTDQLESATWHEVSVPGELAMQGFAIKHDKSYLYKRTFSVPSNFLGNSIILRFDGVYSEATIWVNGQKAGHHIGGFTRWELDVTDIVNEEENSLLVEVKDRWDDISWASGYAQHQIGGILKPVTLRAVPKNRLDFFYVETDFDDNYKDAKLKLEMGSSSEKSLDVTLTLKDSNGKNIHLENKHTSVKAGKSISVENLITEPLEWEAEHPNLYKLEVTVSDSIQTYTFDQKIGFREIKVVGDQLLVNGKPVKLRGANRHEIHPTLGRISTPELDKQDVLLAKEANINFIRTSHYPPSENFLALCDEYGLYVEDESGACFLETYRAEEYKPDPFQHDPDYEDWFIDQLAEMIHWHRNHPSIIIWSIGNENKYGANFQKSYEFVKRTDKTRPVIFSFPGTVPDSQKVFDILSMHYVDINGTREEWGKVIENFSAPNIPTVHDEYVHVACYNMATIREDANVRDFWGRSMDIMWSKIFDTPGALGGAIWGMLDETFMLPIENPGRKEWWGFSGYDYPSNTVGYGEWGIIDTWRRKKPEFWNTKKVYSPTKVFADQVQIEDGVILVPVYNRFDHTDFAELSIKWKYGVLSGNIEDVNLAPRAKGTLKIQLADVFDASEKLDLKFYKGDRLIDEYLLPIVVQDEPQIVRNPDASLVFEIDEKNGFVKNLGLGKNQILIDAGPKLFFRTLTDSVVGITEQYIGDLADHLQVVQVDQRTDGVVSIGQINGVNIELETKINGDQIHCSLYIEGEITDALVREVGLEFTLPSVYDSLSWERSGYWTSYPENHVSGLTGKVSLKQMNEQIYREQPTGEWGFDTQSFFYDGIENQEKLTYIASGYKEDIKSYTLHSKIGNLSVVNNQNNKTNARIFASDGGIKLRLSQLMDYPNMNWGNFMHQLKVPAGYRAEFNLQLSR
jgi:hypothetical protein